jgi:hypothetical protein
MIIRLLKIDNRSIFQLVEAHLLMGVTLFTSTALFLLSQKMLLNLDATVDADGAIRVFFFENLELKLLRLA